MLRLQWFFLQVLEHLHMRVLRIDGDGGGTRGRKRVFPSGLPVWCGFRGAVEAGRLRRHGADLAIPDVIGATVATLRR